MSMPLCCVTIFHYSHDVFAGRNLYEVIRLMDALQVVTLQRVVCPSNWGNGQDVLVRNDVSSAEATKTLPKGFVEIKPWFRLTPCPDDS